MDQMGTKEIVLEYLRVILSAPPMVAVTVIFMLVLFREDIKALLLRVAAIRLPGGAELLMPQSQRQEGETHNRLPEVQPPVVEIPNLSTQQRQEIENLIKSERANAYQWEYRYLNHFLVRGTQVVLDWLASMPQPISIHFATSFWLPIIPSTEERVAIVKALEAHQLIQVEGDAIEVTPKGREYLQWRGPLPPVVPTGAVGAGR
jgi:hypothetical protein